MLVDLHSVRSCLEAIGDGSCRRGGLAIAEVLKVRETAMWRWVSEDQFPAKTYLLIQRRLGALGFRAVDTLFTMAVEAEKVGPAEPEAA